MHVIDLPYSLVIEATQEPDFFGFYSPELKGFTGIGHLGRGLPVQGAMGNERAREIAPSATIGSSES
jgi:hypothetical protein